MPPEDVDVVGPREPDSAGERGAHAEVLDERRRNGQPEQREPGEAREDVDRDEERNGQEDDDRHEVRHERLLPQERRAQHERHGSHVAQRDEQRRHRQQREPLIAARALPHEGVRHDDRNAQSQRPPELRPVRADRLADELADRPLRGGKRRRQGTLSLLRSPRHGRRGY